MKLASTLWVLAALEAAEPAQTVFREDPTSHISHAGNGFPAVVDHPSWRPLGQKIKDVAIIGAGASGLIVANELRDHGFNIRVYERDRSPGGVWYYSQEVAPAVPHNQSNPQFGDFTPSVPSSFPYHEVHSSGFSKARQCKSRNHRAPKQVWRDLHSNAPSPLQQITAWPWPAGQPWRTTQWSLSRYLRSYATFLGLSPDEEYAAQNRTPIAIYNTRVEDVRKNASTNKWVITLKRLQRHGEDGYRVDWWQETADAVVVASGRYNSPHVPDIPGLGDLLEVFPDQVFHSRSYRYPEPWTNKTVLVVGISISASEISRELAPYIDHGRLLQSVREKPNSTDSSVFPAYNRTLQFGRLPEKAEVIPAIKSIRLPAHATNLQEAEIRLINDTIITGVDGIIFGTGYAYSLPFLPQFHNFSAGPNDTEFRVPPIVTDGTHLRSLYLDTFYIPDPTLAFISLSRLIGDWTWGAYQALALAKAWTNTLDLPSKEDQWYLHFERVKTRGGYTPTFQFYGTRAPQAYRYLIGWLNAAGVKYGGKQVDQLPSYRDEIGYYFSTALWGFDFTDSKYTRPGYGDQAVHDSAPPLGVDVSSDSLDW